MKKSGRYGAINALTGKIILPATNDTIMSTGMARPGFIVIKQGKYGYVGDDFLCKPIFDFQIDGREKFQGYKVLFIGYRNNHQGGYADKKGFPYFKN